MLAERNACGAFTSLRFLDFKFVINIRKNTENSFIIFFCFTFFFFCFTFYITSDTSSQLNNRFMSDHSCYLINFLIPYTGRFKSIMYGGYI